MPNTCVLYVVGSFLFFALAVFGLENYLWFLENFHFLSWDDSRTFSNYLIHDFICLRWSELSVTLEVFDGSPKSLIDRNPVYRTFWNTKFNIRWMWFTIIRYRRMSFIQFLPFSLKKMVNMCMIMVISLAWSSLSSFYVQAPSPLGLCPTQLVYNRQSHSSPPFPPFSMFNQVTLLSWRQATRCHDSVCHLVSTKLL